MQYDQHAIIERRRDFLRRMCVPCTAPRGQSYATAAIKNILEFEAGRLSEWDTIVLLASVGIHPDRDGRYQLRRMTLEKLLKVVFPRLTTRNQQRRRVAIPAVRL